ncbi:MAG TPA: hydroxyacid dehydrogenase [Clostridiaceae bacterium]|nr:hydroxyacid dehydrogenase [Clostridiaceae bacterium]
MKILVAMPKGVVRDSFIPKDVEEAINSLGEVEWNNTEKLFTEEELRDRLEGKDVCITGWGNPKFTEKVLEKAKDLKIVAHTGGTVAPIVSDYLYDMGVKVISGNLYYAESVAEGVIAYILAALRDIPYYANMMKEGGWKKPDYYIEGLLDHTVGLVGFGTITRFVINMLKPFRVKIKVFSKHLKEEDMQKYGIEKASLEEIFSTCKIISIHSAQRPDTYHMINKRLLEMIPDGALLVNTARGSIIDEEALIEELSKGRFKAILDVFEQEPLPDDSKLRKMDNVILIPHMAGPTVDRRRYVTLGLIEDINAYFKGEPMKNEISKEYAAYMTR